MKISNRVATVHAIVVAAGGHAMLQPARMLALLPYPYQLRIMATATAVIDWQLGACAQTSAVLTAACFRIGP